MTLEEFQRKLDKKRRKRIELEVQRDRKAQLEALESQIKVLKRELR